MRNKQPRRRLQRNPKISQLPTKVKTRVVWVGGRPEVAHLKAHEKRTATGNATTKWQQARPATASVAVAEGAWRSRLATTGLSIVQPCALAHVQGGGRQAGARLLVPAKTTAICRVMLKCLPAHPGTASVAVEGAPLSQTATTVPSCAQ